MSALVVVCMSSKGSRPHRKILARLEGTTLRVTSGVRWSAQVDPDDRDRTTALAFWCPEHGYDRDVTWAEVRSAVARSAGRPVEIHLHPRRVVPPPPHNGAIG